jgi:hypothetical protein
VQRPASARRDAGEVLDVDVDELARSVPLVAPDRLAVGGAVPDVEPAKASALRIDLTVDAAPSS